MRALYDRVMVYFPLRRIEEADDKELPREEADVSVLSHLPPVTVRLLLTV